MIYGINFGAPDIPDGIRKKFPAQQKFDLPRGHYARLVGVGQSYEEKETMMMAATNDTRRLWVVEKQTAGGVWYGIYAY